MKKIVIIAIISVVTAFSLSAKEPVKTVKPIVMDTKMFKELVFDYDNNPTEWKYQGDKPAIIDFWAAWCAPCKKLSPILDELAVEYGEDIVIYKINVDEEKELAAKFGIRSIPTILFIPVNDKPQVAQGALPKDALKNVIDSFLLNKSDKKTEK